MRLKTSFGERDRSYSSVCKRTKARRCNDASRTPSTIERPRGRYGKTGCKNTSRSPRTPTGQQSARTSLAVGKTGFEQIGSQESTGSRRHRHHIGHAGRWSGPLVPESLRHDRKNAVFFTGYQHATPAVVGCWKQVLSIYGQRVDVPLQTEQFSFSTHAGHQEILEFAKACQAKHVVVYHTDPNHARPLSLRRFHNKPIVHEPKNGESYIIE